MELYSIFNMKKIAEMKKVIKEYEQRSIAENKYFLLSSKYAKNIFQKAKNIQSYTEMFELFKEWDEYGSIPLELGQQIESMLQDSTINIGIHRTGGYGKIDNNQLDNNELLTSIFTNGLKNYGDLSSGAVTQDTIHPNKTISMLTNPLTAMILLKTQYKDSKGAVVVVFPSNYVNKEGELIAEEEDVYYRDDTGTLIVKPEYLIGYVARENGLCTYYPKEKFLSKTNTNNK